MITLKYWNSLPNDKRRRIVDIIYGHLSVETRQMLAAPFHHNLDWPGDTYTLDGQWYRVILSRCSLQKDGRIRVTLTV